MRVSTRITIITLVGTAAFFACGLALRHHTTRAQTTELILDLGALGGAESRAYGINAAGQVVGYSSTASGRFNAFLWDGTMRSLGTLPNAAESFAYAINDNGQITGVSLDLGSVAPRAFRWQNGVLTELGAFAPRAINKSGEIVGALNVKRGNAGGVDWFEHACLWRNGTLTDLGTLAGSFSYANGISDAGQIVGHSFAADNATTRGFLWQGGTLADLGPTGSERIQAYAINDKYVTGFLETPAGAPHAFLYTLGAAGVSERLDLGTAGSAYSYGYAVNSKRQVVGTNGHAMLWQNGAAIDLNTLVSPDEGWNLQVASAINERGEIAGWGNYFGLRRAFLLRRVSAAPVASVSAASYFANALADESISAAFGVELATATQAGTTIPLPTTLAGTTVRVRDSAGAERLAPLFYVSPTQINYQIPPGTALGAAAITVTNGTSTMSLGSTTIARVAPGLFAVDGTGKGLAAAQVLRIRADGSQSYEAIARFDAPTNTWVALPIDLGAATDQVFLILYGTGLRNRTALTAATVKVGGADAPVNYAGTQGGLVGLDQINALLPRTLAGRGEVDVVLSVDGLTANPVRVNIR
mgnify:CR=1 FL=1